MNYLILDIIEVFEDFLERRGVEIPTSVQEMKEEDNYEGNSAIIYGMDYAELEEGIAEVLKMPLWESKYRDIRFKKTEGKWTINALKESDVVVAKVDCENKTVEYVDPDAENDAYARDLVRGLLEGWGTW